MIDPHAVVKEFLEKRSELDGVSLFAGRSVPPEGYSPDDSGDCLVFKVRGGDSDYEDALLRPSVQFKAYSTSELNAYTLYQTLDDVLHGAHSADILHCERENMGQLLEEAETEWPYVLAYFKFVLRQTDTD